MDQSRLWSQSPCGALELRPGDLPIVECGQIADARLEVRRLRPQEIGHRGQPCFIAVLKDTQAFPRLSDGIARRFRPLARCENIEISLSHLEPHARPKPFQLTGCLPRQRLRLRQPIAIAATCKQVHLQACACRPVRARGTAKRLGVTLELGKQAEPRPELCLGQFPIVGGRLSSELGGTQPGTPRSQARSCWRLARLGSESLPGSQQ